MQFLSVSEITSQIKSTLSNHFSRVCVEGEIGSLTLHQSGHCYFTLKDSNASIKCVLFSGNRARLNFTLETAMKIQVEGNLGVYESRGEYQIICAKITQSGIGNLALQYEKLKQKLKQKGYFDAPKKPLPAFPRNIAIITSLSGAALQDMKFVAQKRWNLLKITIFDTLVQGEKAKDSIARQIKRASGGDFDIIIIARGGGSVEDLWAFNEEIVQDAIFEAKSAKMPLISAIGHEIDFVLSDFTSDLRAPTPSAAMEIALPDTPEWLQRLSDFSDTLCAIWVNRLKQHQNTLDTLRFRLQAYAFDLPKAEQSLLEIRKDLQRHKALFLARKASLAQNLTQILETKYSNITPLKAQNVRNLREKLHDCAHLFLKDKIAQMPLPNRLESAAQAHIVRKITLLNHTKILLNAKNISQACKRGFAQITHNDTIKSLAELKNGDIITLSDGKSTKDARIV